MLIFFIVAFSLLNRARGTQFFDLTGSTTIGRLVSTAGMALVATPWHAPVYFFVLWLLLYGWTIPAWDAYWSAAIGRDAAHSKWWGVWHMTLRNGLLLPYYTLLVGLNGNLDHLVYTSSILLMGAVYYFAGITAPDGKQIRDAEMYNGMIMGLTTFLILY